MFTILFLAADPTDASRLRLGKELREIQEKLQLAKLRDRFVLQQRMSVRPVDISQALLDLNPQVVHFSGHGTAMGDLCFEDETGKTHPIPPDALADLFEQFSNQVECVVLNACYSEIQAEALAKHIYYVVGMNKAISDTAAIAFTVGFYQALGAGRSVEDAYKLGCIHIKLQGIPENLTPVLIKKKVTPVQTMLKPLAEKSIQSIQPQKARGFSLNQQRLEFDYQRILELVSKSQGRIEIEYTVGQPPEVYVFRFKCKVVATIDHNEPIWAEEVSVSISLSEDYPIRPAGLKVLSPMFHPQVKNTYLCAGWSNSQEGLDVFVRGLYQIIAFHNYSLTTPLSVEAAVWYRQHPEIIEELQKANSDNVEWLEEQNILVV